MEDMKKHVPHADMEKLKQVLAIKEAYNDRKLSLEEARTQLKEKVGSLKPYEIALAEQELQEVSDDECRKEDIQQMLELFEGIMDVSRPELPEEHPIMCYYRENDELRKILLSVEDLVQYPLIKNQWLEVYDRLADFRIHLSRKQNQLYPILEKKGFDRPTTTMWLLDDFVRDEIKEARALLDADKDDEFIDRQKRILHDVRDLLDKEENVLYPTSLAMISTEEFEEMKSGDREIGFAWIEASKQERPIGTSTGNTPDTDGLAGELAALLSKYGYGGLGTAAPLPVATGELTLEQINLIYRHMPVDLSYVDENELVRFYTDTKHRVFPRSKNVISRNVKNCHPRTSVHVVEEIIEKFRNGEQDHAEFWINKPGFFVYIYYVAVRDEQGRFRGILEMMQDCTHIRSLEGSRTLLTWENEQGTESSASPAPTPEAEETEETDNTPVTPVEAADINADTLLKDLFGTYPKLKGRMEEINPKFKMLRTPLARVLMAKATIGTASERSGMPLDKLIAAIRSKIAETGE